MSTNKRVDYENYSASKNKVVERVTLSLPKTPTTTLLLIDRDFTDVTKRRMAELVWVSNRTPNLILSTSELRNSNRTGLCRNRKHELIGVIGLPTPT